VSHDHAFGHATSGSVPSLLVWLAPIALVAAGIWVVRLLVGIDRTDPRPARGMGTLGWLGLGAFAAIIVGTVAVVATGQAASTGTGNQNVIDDLCAASTVAPSDLDRASALFNDRPHQAFHSIEGPLRRTDALLAADVASAKADAEVALASGNPNASERLADLAGEMVAAYAALDPDDQLRSCG
jgi:hypothetical protein